MAKSGLGPIEEMTIMAKFSRCNALLSLALNEAGEGCRYIAKAETEQEVIDDMIKHMSKVHEVDANELIGNIKGTMKTTRR